MKTRRPSLGCVILAVGISMSGADAGAQSHVATGTVDSIARSRAPFGVTVLDSTQLRAAPSASPLGLLGGKVPGLRTVAVSNQPGIVPTLVLRSTASRAAEPLVVVDGVASRLSSTDFNAEDVERIEVIGGGAAGAIYGADAANGVIHIITKRGRGTDSRGPAFSLRTEMGRNAPPQRLPGGTHHNYRMNAAGTDYLRDTNGNPQYEPDGIADNPYPATYDLQSYLVESRLTRSAHLSATDRVGSTSYYVAVHEDRDPGFFRMLSGLSRQNVRLNLDHAIGSRLQVSADALVARSRSDLTESEVSWLQSARLIEPDARLDSVSSACPTGMASCYSWLIQQQGLNPLYDLQSTDRNDKRDRTVGTLRASYRLTGWLSAHAAYSNDQLAERASRNQFYPAAGGRTESISAERLDASQHVASTTVALGANRSWSGGSVAQSTSLVWIDERQSIHEEAQTVTEFVGPPPLQGSAGRGAFWDDRLSGLMLATQLDFGNRITVDGAIRREESRRFNKPDARLYHRVGASYVLRDGQPGAVKLRVLHGTAAQAIPRLSQPKLIPFDFNSPSPAYLYAGGVPMARETEFGVDSRLPSGIDLAATYSVKRTDELFAVPASLSVFQYFVLEKVAQVRGKSIEARLGADVVRRPAAAWRVDVSASRTTSRFARLSSYERTYGPQSAFILRDGSEVGTIYGLRWIRTQSQLEQTIAKGYLAGPADAYRQNEDGYYVRVAQFHTVNETPLVAMGCQLTDPCTPVQGAPRPPTRLGQTTPDLELDLNNVASWRSFSAHATIVMALGGQVFNYARRLAMLYGRDPLIDQSGKPDPVNCPQTVPADPCAYSTGKKPMQYYQRLAVSANENLIEDGSFARMRELAIEWRLPQGWVAKLPLSVDGARVSMIGRNLWTLTRYTGSDPDVATTYDGALLYRVDAGTYPAYRTVSAALTLDF